MMSTDLLILVSTNAEADAIGEIQGARTIVSGVGRVNAACATTEALARVPSKAVLNVGIAGALPGSNLAIGDVVVASESVYHEEGILTPDGFQDCEALGFPLGEFAGNRVPADPALLETLRSDMHAGVIATVATCSGTDAAADEVVRRTGALAEAMEGAAVVHAARRMSTPAIEVRVISNTTGDRHGQTWDIPMAFESLRRAAGLACELVLGRNPSF